MAEAYDAAIRRRLGIIGDMGNYTPPAVQRMSAGGGGGGGGGNFGNMPSYAGPGGHKYSGPRGNQQALINFGKYLQSQGFRISENSYFNGGRRIRSGHVRNSRHYSDRAIDVNYAPGTSRREQQAIDRIVGLARLYGLRYIWRGRGSWGGHVGGHHGHAHFDY